MVRRTQHFLFIAIIFVLMIMLSTVIAYADDSQGLEFISNGDGTCYVKSIGTCTDLDLRIPAVSPEGDRVTGIGEEAFFRGKMKSVLIPEHVTYIGKKAFSNCVMLNKVYIDAYTLEDCTSDTLAFIGAGTKGDGICLVMGASATRIPAHLFNTGWYSEEWNLPKLISIEFEEGSECSYIGKYAFYGGKYLTNIDFPENSKITSIDLCAFSGCTGLTSIRFPASMKWLNDHAFTDCVSLASITVEEGNTIFHSCGNCLIETNGKKLIMGCKNSRIPDDGSVTSIGTHAFSDCQGLTEVVIPETVKVINDYAFWACYDLGNVIFSECLTHIGDYAFFCCASLTNVVITDSVTHIGKSAFARCRLLENVIISGNANLKTIGDLAFEECNALTEFFFPESVTSIGTGLFRECYSLESITVAKGNPIYHGSGNCVVDKTCNKLIVGCKNSVIPNDGSVTTIGEEAFYKCSFLKSIDIPYGVTSIEDYAFFYCNALENVTLPPTVVSIGSYAFSQCHSINSITLPEQLKNIGFSGFECCLRLKEIRFNAIAMNDLNNNTFDSVFKKAGEKGDGIRLIIGKSVTAIPACMFKQNKRPSEYSPRITIVEFESGSACTSIREAAFAYCETITDVYYNDIREEWNKVFVEPFNEPFLNARFHFLDDPVETEPETEPETELETEPETEPETESETESETEPETESEAESETQSETNPVTEAPSDDLATTEEPTAEELSTTPTIMIGCSGSILSCGLLMLIALAGAALVKRKE